MEKEIKLNQEDFDKALLHDEIILTDSYGNVVICEVKDRMSNAEC